MPTFDEEDYVAHYGTPRHSGRYPWGYDEDGDGEDARNPTISMQVAALKKQGLSSTDIAKGLGFESTTQLRARMTIEKAQQKHAQILMAQRLHDKGYSNTKIGERMGLNESVVRTLLAPGAAHKAEVLTATADALAKHVDAQNYLDVGSGVEAHMGISKEKLAAALAILKERGYDVVPVNVAQIGTGFDTRRKVLVQPGFTQRDAFLNKDQIHLIQSFSDDGGKTWNDFKKPLAIHPDRVAVRYGSEGGAKADGVIFVRPGVADLSLGRSNYAQVRIQVGKDHYLKGMAMYKDDLPEGTDLLFNTNKESTGNKLDAMKPLLKDNPDFPFGTYIRRQILSSDGKKPLSVMNIVNEEGNWADWRRRISAQVLSKQPPSTARRQLDLTYKTRKREFEEISALTNPTVKKKLLEEFAKQTDGAAVDLHAAGLPRQAWHAILPLESLSPHEVYAPNYKDGERVVLIRYPHAGTFEIPELTVNNRNREARKAIPAGSVDAIGIHHSVAQRLSGADFDGDTVLVIPNNSQSIRHTPALEGLKKFDPMVYKIPGWNPTPEEQKKAEKRKQQLIGDVSNLITDMTIRGASHDKIARAVRHSMVAIDSAKHGLDVRQSALDNGIAALKREYQSAHQARGRGGASTLVSRAGSRIDLPQRKPRPHKDGGPMDKTTGELVYVPTGRTEKNKQGQIVPIMERHEKLAVTGDAHTLSSGTPVEKMYADHSNKLKSLANEARLSAFRTPPLKRSQSAAKAYHAEVKSLDEKLAIAVRNRPLERHANTLAANAVKALKQANPNLDGDAFRRMKYQQLEIARARVGAKKKLIDITPREWHAIQAGAISNSKLAQILANTDIDRIRELATPKREHLMTTGKTSLAKQLLESGYTRAQVAERLGVSLTTLDVATHDRRS